MAKFKTAPEVFHPTFLPVAHPRLVIKTVAEANGLKVDELLERLGLSKAQMNQYYRRLEGDRGRSTRPLSPAGRARCKKLLQWEPPMEPGDE